MAKNTGTAITATFDAAAAEAQLSELMQIDNPDDEAMAFGLVHDLNNHRRAEELAATEAQLCALMEIDNPDDDAMAFDLMRKINKLKPRVQ